jgi:hypothetical protein
MVAADVIFLGLRRGWRCGDHVLHMLILDALVAGVIAATSSRMGLSTVVCSQQTAAV